LGVSPTLAPFFYKKYMALTPTLSFTVRNDNKLLTINDTTVDYGIGGNINVTDITALTLDVKVVTSNNISTVYDTINLFSYLGHLLIKQH